MNNGFAEEPQVTFERVWWTTTSLSPLVVSLREDVAYGVAMLVISSVCAHERAESRRARHISEFLKPFGGERVQRLLEWPHSRSLRSLHQTLLINGIRRRDSPLPITVSLRRL